MPREVIAIDIDDVLADSTEALRLEVNDKLKIDLSADHYKVPGDYWNYYETIWKQHGLEGRISMENLDPKMAEDQSHIHPTLGSREALDKLSKDYDLIVVTGRSSDWEEATHDWLQDYFPGLFAKIIFGDGFEALQAKSKGQLCLENNASYLIDDNVEHALSAKEKGVEIILFGEYGWHHKAPPHFHRCRNWTQVLEFFDAKG